jgi:WhiB family redox-sensing transcriptional regulator
VDAENFVIGRGQQFSRRDLCDECPVRQECLEVALADESLQGLWSGTTEIERRQIRRGRVA